MNVAAWGSIGAVLVSAGVLGWSIFREGRERKERRRTRWLDRKRAVYADYAYAVRAARAAALGVPLDGVAFAIGDDADEGLEHSKSAAAGLSRLYEELILLAPAAVNEPANELRRLVWEFATDLDPANQFMHDESFNQQRALMLDAMRVDLDPR